MLSASKPFYDFGHIGSSAFDALGFTEHFNISEISSFKSHNRLHWDVYGTESKINLCKQIINPSSTNNEHHGLAVFMSHLYKNNEPSAS